MTPFRVMTMITLVMLMTGTAGAQQGPSGETGKTEATAKAPTVSPTKAADDGGTATPATIDQIRQQIEDARADYARVGKMTMVAGALPAELVERDYLLGELMATLQRYLDILERQPDAQRRAADQNEKTNAWVPIPSPPAVSILAVDRQREALENTRSRLKSSQQRDNFRDQQIASEEKRLKSSEVTIRQQAERIDAAATGPQKAREIWLRDLARLRSRAAAAGMDEAQAAKLLDRAEISELKALETLQARQLEEMISHERFTETELTSVLADLDRQIAQLQTRQMRIQVSSAQSHRQLDQAQRTLAQYKASARPAAAGGKPDQKLAALERTVALRRLQADSDDLVDDTLRRMIEGSGWVRTGWQFRWHLVNNPNDPEKTGEARGNLDTTIQKLDNWRHYLGQELARIRPLAEDDGLSHATASTKAEADEAIAQRAAYRQQAAILNEAETLAESLVHTFRNWNQDLQSRNDDQPLSFTFRDAIATLASLGRAVWDFELFAAQDTIEVDGRRITAARSVTIGKSLGVILLVVLGAVLSRRLLTLLGKIASRHFRVSQDHTSTVTRWLHIVVVSMLFISALYIANIPLTIFAFLGGALAIGVGFGTQVILKNMISGIILLVERPLRVGDIVEVGSVIGTVTHINIRSSTVRTSDGIEILVPNSTFIESNVTNWTYSNARVRRSVAVGTDYAAPPKQVESVLMEVARQHPSVLNDPEPCVLLSEFGTDSINFILRYWIDYTGGADSSKIASELRFLIAEHLGRAGIDIPFPQRVVHLRHANNTPCVTTGQAETDPPAVLADGDQKHAVPA